MPRLINYFIYALRCMWLILVDRHSRVSNAIDKSLPLTALGGFIASALPIALLMWGLAHAHKLDIGSILYLLVGGSIVYVGLLTLMYFIKFKPMKAERERGRD